MVYNKLSQIYLVSRTPSADTTKESIKPDDFYTGYVLQIVLFAAWPPSHSATCAVSGFGEHRQMTIAIIFAVFGTLSGVVYWVLGLIASAHFLNTNASSSDRFISAALLWSLSFGQYDDEGKKICRQGNIAFVIAACSWIGYAALI